MVTLNSLALVCTGFALCKKLAWHFLKIQENSSNKIFCVFIKLIKLLETIILWTMSAWNFLIFAIYFSTIFSGVWNVLNIPSAITFFPMLYLVLALTDCILEHTNIFTCTIIIIVALVCIRTNFFFLIYFSGLLWLIAHSK